MTAVEFIEACEQMATKEGYDELVAFYCNQQFCKDLIEMVNKPIPELSDEQIEKEALQYCYINSVNKLDLDDKYNIFIYAINWYREQLKQRQ